MALTFKPNNVLAVLIQGGGWLTIDEGSLQLDTLELQPPSPTSEAEDYGFRCIDSATNQVVYGRLSALLAVKV